MLVLVLLLLHFLIILLLLHLLLLLLLLSVLLLQVELPAAAGADGGADITEEEERGVKQDLNPFKGLTPVQKEEGF